MRLAFCTCGGLKGECGCRPAPKSAETSYNWAWTKKSKRIRKERPLCEDCLKEDKVTPSVEVHHKVSIKEDRSLMLVDANLVALCKDCHDKRHVE